MPNGAQNLGSQLGSLLFGSNDNTSYLRGQQAGATVQSALEAARLARAKAINQEGQNSAIPELAAAAAKLGLGDDQAAGYQTLAQAGGGDVTALVKALGLVRGQGYQADARMAALGGDYNAANANLVGLADKPLDLTKIAGGQQYNPLVTPDAGQSFTTPLGLADIGLRHAQAGASVAQANAANAHARLFDKQTSVGGFNPHSGEGLGTMVPAANPNGPHGDAYLSAIDPTKAAQVKALAEGRMAFPTGTALKSPYWQAMLQDVAQYDPTFDAVNYNARAGTRKAFTSGPESRTVNSLNTVAEHLGTLSDYAGDLNNTSFQPYNRMKNAAAEMFGDKDIAKFNTAKKAVADEVAKVWRASGGSQMDIEENLKNLDGAQSPEQLNAAIGTLTKLIGGKVAALQDQYTSGMGTTKDTRPLVSPEAKSAFDKTISRSGLAPDDFGKLGELAAPATATGVAPRAGQIDGGYRFKGGDPANPMNWEKQ